ncbi:pneumococcal-type histidine triad protein, partial [Streptococcus sp. DD11]|uniref:pneumococcal-type histidine triad protein n=1 Tax=Streptococcus sp. DD11 TaxID=1777879 RepID=UPI0013E33404
SLAAGNSLASLTSGSRRENGHYTTDDGYVFHPTDVIQDTGDAFIVPHGNHFHYIPKSDLSSAELAAAQLYWNSRRTAVSPAAPVLAGGPVIQQPAVSQAGQPVMGNAGSSGPFISHQPSQPAPSRPSTAPANQPVQPQDRKNVNPTVQDLLKQLYALPKEQRHVEADGLLYDPAQIVRWTDTGVAVPHGDHYHFIPYEQLSPLEQQISRLLTGQPSANAVSPNPEQPLPSVSEAETLPVKEADLPAQLVRKADQGYVFQKEGHYRYILAKDLSQLAVAQLEKRWEEMSPAPALPAVSLPEPKADVDARNQEFYQTVYQILAASHERLLASKGRLADFQRLQQLLTQLNAEGSDKSRLVDELLAFTAPILHPERLGRPNAQIVYTAKEIRAAQLADKYTTSDGYIFDAHDIISDEGVAYVTPHMGHSHWIGKDSLSAAEKAAAQTVAHEKGLLPPAADDKSYFKADGESAQAIYNRVSAANMIPLVRLPYHVEHTVEVKNGNLIIPHKDHYHNIKFAWFDDGSYKAPAGYSIEELFATIKYYVEHPEARPLSEDGWGSSSDHALGKDTEPAGDAKEEEDEEAAEEPAEEQVPSERVAEKLQEAESLFVQLGPSPLRDTAEETLAGLKSSFLLGTQDNNSIMKQTEELLLKLQKELALGKPAETAGASAVPAGSTEEPAAQPADAQAEREDRSPADTDLYLPQPDSSSD